MECAACFPKAEGECSAEVSCDGAAEPVETNGGLREEDKEEEGLECERSGVVKVAVDIEG